MWFDSWADVLRTLAVGSAAYVTVVLVLRVSGKRTLSQLNAFDFVVTVALGSTLATILLSSDVAWAEGFTALAVLALLQFVVAWITTRWPFAKRAVTSEPVILVKGGILQDVAIRRNRLTASEVYQAVRGSGYGDLAGIEAVVLETNGTISVIASSTYGNGSAMVGVPQGP